MTTDRRLLPRIARTSQHPLTAGVPPGSPSKCPGLRERCAHVKQLQ